MFRIFRQVVEVGSYNSFEATKNTFAEVVQLLKIRKY